MLFAVKRNALASGLLLAAMVLVSAWGARALGIPLELRFEASSIAWVAGGLAVVVVSDALVHAGLIFSARQWYLAHYRALVEYFGRQGVAAIIAGALLAGGEELLFRGVVLEAARNVVGWPTSWAIALSAGLFGLAHLVCRRALAPFAIWAAWQGVLLGVVYVWSGSLLVNVNIHLLHDALGFSLFSYQRRVGRIPFT